MHEQVERLSSDLSRLTRS
ncbi:hypothetical protein OFN71_23440 [Escherichia coli]|nr:hypothetical protein [Escherichia coli]MCV5886191.1 hypothetical protein [Escherichia coli]